MRYMEAGMLEPQRKPLVPNKLISGMLPGATQIRIGGDDGIMIDGKNRVVSVASGDAMVSLGKTSTTTLGVGFTDGTGVTRFHAGVYPDNSVKMKLSQSTYDVTTATDDQLIWSSDFNLFKVVASDTATVTVTDPIASGTSITTTVAHGLSGTPAYVAFVNIPSYAGYTGSGQLTNVPGDVLGTVGASGGQIFLRGNCRVDATNIYFDVTNVSSGSLTGLAGDWEFKYYLLIETAA